MALTPPPAVPQRGDRTTFSQRVDAFLTWMANIIPQLNQFIARLETIAAGGAYALPYSLTGDPQNIGGVNGGIMAFTNNGSTLSIDTKDATGKNVAALLASFGNSNSSTKGHIRIQKQSDASKWLVYSLQSFVNDSSGFYGYGAITFVNGSAGLSSPFEPGDPVMLFFQRTGDKGDKGDSGTLFAPALHVRDERASGQSGGSPLVNQDWNLRALLAVKTNTIQGASLSNNRVTLPAGTYEYEGSAPASATSEHQARLYNVTDQTVVGLGTSEVATSTGGKPPTTRSFIQGRFTITATKVFELQHWVFNGGNQFAGGYPVSNGGIEVYSEIIFRKAT